MQVSGELTFATVAAVLRDSDRLFGHDTTPLALDLSRVSRADSAGLALLIHWLREARRSGREIIFHHLPKQMLAIAQVSDLQDILPRGEA